MYELNQLVGRGIFALGIFILLCVAFWFSFLAGTILLGLVLVVAGMVIGEMVDM